MLRRLLAHPLTRGMDLDDPATTELRRRIIREKRFLHRIYNEWYERIVDRVPAPPGRVLELGSGAGFLKEILPEVITSEVLPIDGVDLIAFGEDLPFDDGALRAIVMSDVLHHVPDVSAFFAEARRCVRPGGRIVMIEPWSSRWSRFVYGRLHHEPFRPDADTWSFPATGPLSGANGAIPWIVFERDREEFERAFPEWRIDAIEPLMPLRYLLSGGVSMRLLVPNWTHGAWCAIERTLLTWPRTWAMFALIVLERTDDPEPGAR